MKRNRAFWISVAMAAATSDAFYLHAPPPPTITSKRRLRPLVVSSFSTSSCRASTWHFGATKNKSDVSNEKDPPSDSNNDKEGVIKSFGNLFSQEEKAKEETKTAPNEDKGGVFRGLFKKKDEQPEPPPPKEEKSGFRGMFKPKEETSSKDDTKWDKKKKTKEVKEKSRTKDETKDKDDKGGMLSKLFASKDPAEKVEASSSSSSSFSRFQFFSGGSKDDEKAKDMADNMAKNSTNPLSVAQKFVTNTFFSSGPKEEWLVACPKTSLSPGQIVPVTVAGIDLLLIASIDGQSLYCIGNSCPHLGTPLETGALVRLPMEESAQDDKEGGSSSSSSNPIPTMLTETDISNILNQDGCELCIVCPLHRTAFALESGEVRGEWCPYPPVVGKLMGTVKNPTSAAVFDVRTRGKNVEVRLNSVLEPKEKGAQS